jgi:hypothetical protein
MDSKNSSRSSSPEPKTQITEKIPEEIRDSLKTKPEKKVSGRNAPRTDKQMEALRKGMAKLKENRELRAKEKEDRKKTNVLLKEKGLPPIEPPVKLKKIEAVELKPVKIEPVEIKIKERKVRVDKGLPKNKDPQLKNITKKEFDEMKAMMAQLKPTERVVEKEVVREVPVTREKVVEREKVLSGSDLLNKIFFNK